jgi:hypothetical protein
MELFMFEKPVSHLQLKAKLRRNRYDLFHHDGLLIDAEVGPIVKNGANKEDNEGFLPIHTGVLYAQDTGQFQTILDVSRFSAAPSSHLSGYPFESQGAFPA